MSGEGHAKWDITEGGHEKIPAHSNVTTEKNSLNEELRSMIAALCESSIGLQSFRIA